MSIATTPVARYTSNEPILTTTGSDAQRQLAVMRTRLIARYNLVNVPGRGEELQKPGTDRGVSIGYGCKTIRVRGMVGRNWIDDLTHDFQISDGWSSTLYGLLDRHFGFTSPKILAQGILIRDNQQLYGMPRPIRDNPQA